MSNVELKPCPFCGGTAHIEVDDVQEPEMFWHYSPRCDNWGCLGHTFWFMYDTEEDAIEAWNTRHERTVKLGESDRCPDCKKLVGTGENYCAWCGAKVIKE